TPAARQVDLVLAHADPARASRVHRAAAEMRRVRDQPVVSELAGMTLPPIDRSGLIATRRDLPQHPQLGFEERRTSGLGAERRQRLGYTVRTGVGKTGVVGLRSEEHTSE